MWVDGKYFLTLNKINIFLNDEMMMGKAGEFHNKFVNQKNEINGLIDRKNCDIFSQYSTIVKIFFMVLQ